jgi:23S rRNA pseudouridine1911/1915/1917 synthase
MKSPQEEPANYSRTRLLRFLVPDDAAGLRLDQVLAGLIPEHSRNRLQAWVREGQVTVDGQAASEPKIRVAAGAEIGVSLPAEAGDAADQAEDIPLTVVFEDDDLLVIDKPAGLVVHPGSGNRNGTLMNALLHRIPGLADVPRAGIVHRLDKDTSGLLVVARTLAAQTDLVRQLQARTVKRQYFAVVAGSVRRDATVDAPVGRHPVHRTRMAVVPASRGGKPAVTHFRVLEQFAQAAAVECSLETGRTHQIRVHMASIGHPLIGDPVYARRDPRLPAFPRQALHAMRLGLVHPSSRRPMQWESPLPEDIRALLEFLRGA